MSNVYAEFAAGENAVATSTPQSRPIPGRETEMKQNTEKAPDIRCQCTGNQDEEIWPPPCIKAQPMHHRCAPLAIASASFRRRFST